MFCVKRNIWKADKPATVTPNPSEVKWLPSVVLGCEGFYSKTIRSIIFILRVFIWLAKIIKVTKFQVRTSSLIGASGRRKLSEVNWLPPVVLVLSCHIERNKGFKESVPFVSLLCRWIHEEGAFSYYGSIWKLWNSNSSPYLFRSQNNKVQTARFQKSVLSN